MKKNRRFVTLLEMVIAMGLVAILLTFLMNFFYQAVAANQEIEKAQRKTFRSLYAQQRLNEILPRAVGPDNDESLFYTRPKEGMKELSDSLIFVYDNGTGAGPLFSNEVIGKIFVNAQNQLVIYSWPSYFRHPEINPPMRKEVLLEGVKTLQFSFYTPPKPKTENLTIDPESELQGYNQWSSTWDRKEGMIPAIVKLEITLADQNDPLIYAFILPNNGMPIFYP